MRNYKKQFDSHKLQKIKERRLFDEEVDSINERLNNISKNNFVDPDLTDDFSSLPILESTKEELKKNKFIKMSPIQKQTLPITLCGKDLIGAAETGSGKTLAFLIPLIEVLKKNKYSSGSGIGAIVISPTRDLAAQTFNVLKNLISGSELNAGLITGGMSFELEQEGFSRLNILIATVGRLKEHVENSQQFNTDNLKFLVLDEADRLMGKGFLKDIKIIIDFLPKDRQTLLFTATANKAIKDLSKVSLNNPTRVLLTELQEFATPENLMQFYTIVTLDQKWNTLYSFLKSHANDKIIVFMETIKMVRFAYESFRHLRPGLPILHLTGKQNSNLRFSVCQDFTNQKRGVIFTTDVAARGLDFPEVNWVLQLDCPSTIETYIHRVGRTARFHSNGKALLFLIPSEKGMIDKLEKSKVTLKPIQISGDKLFDMKPRLVDIISKFSEVKHLAMKAIITYVKSVKMHEDKEIFFLDKVLENIELFSQSFGLLSVPKLNQKLQNKNKDITSDYSNSENEEEELEENKKLQNETFYRIISEDEDDSDSEMKNDNTIHPETMEYLNPNHQISKDEYNNWRKHLQELLGNLKSKKVTKNIEDNKSVNLEDEAAKLLLDDF